jgi:putative lipoic acid-binding regulatory protein
LRKEQHVTTKSIKPISVPSIEALETAHSFPAQYLIKIIGPDTEAFRADAKTICVKHLGPDAQIETSERQSKTGQHLALTLRFQVATPLLVQEIYKNLAQLTGLKFII